jgi:tetratricopeptide (TPR) repeat protein
MKKLSVFIALILLVKLASAQDSVTLDDVKIIKARAEFLITKTYYSLVNTISFTGADENGIKEMINQAIGEGERKIFLAKQVTIGDDVSSPNFRNSASSHDVSVEQYLNDINTLYQKSDDHSIIFGDVKTSNVKKGKKNMFIKVYFTSIFKNKCKASLDTPYVLTAREAEVYLKKTENNKWVTYISRISFLNPADTVNDFSDDIALIGVEKISGSASMDSASKVQLQQNFEKELQQTELKKENEKYDAETKAFNEKMEAGDKAFANHEFVLAMDSYTEAKNMRPYDIAPRTKLDKLLKVQGDLKMDDESRFRQYIEGAALEVKMRNYQNAISLYNKALILKPQESGNLDPKIRDLNARVRILLDLNEKYKDGFYKEVIKAYTDHIKKDKTNSDFYLGRAKCYDKIGELTKSHNEQLKSYAEAMKDYSKSYDLDNNNLETIRRRGDLYKRMGKNLEALREYRTYLLVNKEDVSIYVEMSKLHLAINGSMDDAIGDLNDALNVDLRNANLYYERGLLYAQKKDYSSADQNFSDAIKLDSNKALAYYNRGISRIKLKDIENASNDFATARRKGLDTASIGEIETIAESFFDRGLTKFRAGDRDSAMSLFNSAISIRPNQSNYWFNKGECYYAGGSYQDAFNAYSQAIALSPQYADAYQKRGLSNLHLNKNKEAINDFTKSLQFDTQLYESQKGLGDAYFALKDYKNSIPAYEACFEMKSFKSGDQGTLSAEIYNSIGKANFKLNDFAKALDNFKSAVKKKDAFAEAHYNRGLTYFKLNDSKNAIKEIKYAITLQGNHYEWNYDLARVLEESKIYEEAEYYFAYAIKMDSAHMLNDAVYHHGFCNYKLRNFSAALPDYQKSLPSLPDNTLAAAYNEMGNIYLNLRKYDSAYDCLNKSFLKDSTSGAVLYSIASCYYLKGNTEESFRWFERSFQTKMLEKSAVENDVLLAALKDDKRYKDLKKRYHY